MHATSKITYLHGLESCSKKKTLWIFFIRTLYISWQVSIQTQSLNFALKFYIKLHQEPSVFEVRNKLSNKNSLSCFQWIFFRNMKNVKPLFIYILICLRNSITNNVMGRNSQKLTSSLGYCFMICQASSKWQEVKLLYVDEHCLQRFLIVTREICCCSSILGIRIFASVCFI